jgi:hypothetical protein
MNTPSAASNTWPKNELTEAGSFKNVLKRGSKFGQSWVVQLLKHFLHLLQTS